jgi:NADPH2:quinone reductase
VPDGVDDITAAALPNPGMSSWLALEWRAKLQAGENVLVLGATGVAGTLAVQIAKHLGAGRVVGAGRNAAALERLTDLGADAVISLDGARDEIVARFAAEAASRPFDIVLDYRWGPPAEALIAALTGSDLTAAPTVTRYVEIGSVAGAEIALPAAALRSSGLELYGSGGGSVPPREIFKAIPRLLDLAADGGIQIETEAVPLARVAEAWARRDTGGRRIVLVP